MTDEVTNEEFDNIVSLVVAEIEPIEKFRFLYEKKYSEKMTIEEAQEWINDYIIDSSGSYEPQMNSSLNNQRLPFDVP